MWVLSLHLSGWYLLYGIGKIASQLRLPELTAQGLAWRKCSQLLQCFYTNPLTTSIDALYKELPAWWWKPWNGHVASQQSTTCRYKSLSKMISCWIKHSKCLDADVHIYIIDSWKCTHRFLRPASSLPKCGTELASKCDQISHHMHREWFLLSMVDPFLCQFNFQ